MAASPTAERRREATPGQRRGEGPRLRARARALSLAVGALLLILWPLVPLPDVWIVAVAAIAVMASGLGFGPWPAFVLALPAIGAALLERRPPDVGLLSAYVCMPLLAAAAGGGTGLRLRRVRRAAEDAARRARLLSEALQRLPELTSPQSILQLLPVWLKEILGFAHADVLVPTADGGALLVAATLGLAPRPGARIPLRSVTGRALTAGRAQHVRDVRQDPDFLPGSNDGPSLSELALPIFSGGRAVAVLNVERARPGGFLADEVATLEALSRAVGDALERLGQHAASEERSALQHFLLEFTRQIGGMRSPDAVAQRALDVLLPHSGADVGAIWLCGGPRPHLLATRTARDFRDPDLPSPFVTGFEGRPPEDPLWVGTSVTSPYSSARQLEAGLQSFAVLPLLAQEGRPQGALELLYYRNPAGFAGLQRQVLLRASERLDISLQSSLATSRLMDMLLALHSLGALQDVDQLGQEALATAVRLVPGADAATLWLHEGQRLDLRAAQGYADPGGPGAHGRLGTVREAMAWYTGDEKAFLQGLPRILPADRPVGEVRSSIALPLVLEEDLVGLLSIDSLRQEEAFSQEALALAGMFGLQLAVLVTQGRRRTALAVAARTDKLTGIGNRRAFDERIESAWSESQRYHQPLALIILDLQGFKSINDRYGHLAGDQALQAVARALDSVRRDGDSVFRWGGDEFAVLLTHADLAQALQAASRYLNSVQGRPVLHLPGGDVHVGARLGVAAAP